MQQQQRQYKIEPYHERFIVTFLLASNKESRRVCSDVLGPILHFRWIEAYDWTVKEKFNGNYALAQLYIS